MSELTVSTTVSMTPEMMAKLFWEMGSDEQAAFFAALNVEIQTSHAADPKSWAYSLGALQWYYLEKDMLNNKPARDMLMAMAAPLYMHTLTAAPWGNV